MAWWVLRRLVWWLLTKSGASTVVLIVSAVCSLGDCVYALILPPPMCLYDANGNNVQITLMLVFPW